MYHRSRSHPRGTYALLPTRTFINPFSPAGATYYDEDQTILVVRGAPNPWTTRALTTFGSGSPFMIGDTMEIHHDQTLKRVGLVRIIGRVERDKALHGDVPDRKIPHWVFK